MVYQCDHAGVDVADYVNERIDTLEGELDEKVAELENSLTGIQGIFTPECESGSGKRI